MQSRFMAWLWTILAGVSAWAFAGLAFVPNSLAQEVERKKALIDRLDDPTRAKVLATMAGLVILGFLLLALIWMGARYTRRYMNSSSRYVPPPRTALDLDDWAKKPLNDAPGHELQSPGEAGGED